MATGEAARTAAALSLVAGVEPAELEVASLRERLTSAGAIVSL